MYLHTNIKVLRKKAGLTQKELSDKLDKTPMTVGDYERGKSLPPLNIILQLCEIFGVELQTLIYHDIENRGFQSSTSSTQSESLADQLRTQQRINRLQEQRLAELEREIRERAPALARRLGL
jgi:transcriptional regulator with XRE-family HTH domain